MGVVRTAAHGTAPRNEHEGQVPIRERTRLVYKNLLCAYRCRSVERNWSAEVAMTPVDVRRRSCLSGGAKTASVASSCHEWGYQEGKAGCSGGTVAELRVAIRRHG
jgi:hypothetical protein